MGARTQAGPPTRARVAVRPATGADLDTVVRLRLALLREYATHPIYGRLRPDAESRARDLYARQLRAHNEVILLATAGAEPVGVLRCVEMLASPLFYPDRYGYISSVYVLPAMRRHGVLRALLAAAEQWCADRGVAEMRLHNVGAGEAEAAWDALGFIEVEQVRLKQL